MNDAYATDVVDARVVNVEVSDSELMVHASVRASGHMRTYTVKLDNGKTYCREKIVVATGAGPHREPLEVKGLTESHPGVVMDRNTFAQQVESIEYPEKKQSSSMGRTRRSTRPTLRSIGSSTLCG